MKRKKLLALFLAMTLSVAGVSIFLYSSDSILSLRANTDKPSTMSCSYYFDETNEYKSLYELNKKRLDEGESSEQVKTWGTVTCNYYIGSTYSQFIQSTDKYGNVGSTCLYNIGVNNQYPVGSVVTVTGKMTLYNGMSEMTNCTIELDYSSNPSPVVAEEMTSLPISGDSDFSEYRYKGTIEVSLHNLVVGATSSGRQATATLPNNQEILLFYNGCNNKTVINTKLSNLNGKTINVKKGYLTVFSSGNTGTPKFQVLLRDPNDIEEVTTKEISYITATCNKSIYYYGETPSIDDFDVKAYYSDSTIETIHDAYISKNIDTTTLGSQSFTISYSHNGQLYNDTVEVTVVDQITSIRADNPVTMYAINESFIKPKAYGKYGYYGNEVEITDSVTFSPFSNYDELYEEMMIDFVNDSGVTLSTYYHYRVSGVSSLICENVKNEYGIGDSFVKPDVYASYVYDTSTSYSITDRASFSTFDSSTPGEKEITISYAGASTTIYVTVNDEEPDYFTYTLDSSTNTKMGTYDTGNYGSFSNFEYYRAVQSSGNLMGLLPLSSVYTATLPGSLYNTSAIKDIDYVDITYSTSSSYGSVNPRISYGEHNATEGYINLEYSYYSTTTRIDLRSKDVNYIRIDCGDTTMTISEVVISYTNTNTPTGYDYQTSDANNNQVRISPTAYTSSLIDGYSTVDVPTSINTSTGEVLATKTYTYYSYQYVYEHPEYASSAALTDPVDIINYFQAFGCAPANFGCQNTVYPLKDLKDLPSKAQVSSLFGNNARTISQYDKTTGYMQYVPYYGSPLYYELDIATSNDYSIYSRGAGRVIILSTGFDKYDYDYGSQMVSFYSDDHYSTFQEYNNYGGFMPRFNTERRIASAIWSNPITL